MKLIWIYCFGNVVWDMLLESYGEELLLKRCCCEGCAVWSCWWEAVSLMWVSCCWEPLCKAIDDELLVGSCCEELLSRSCCAELMEELLL